jgi:histone H3/H4
MVKISDDIAFRIWIEENKEIRRYQVSDELLISRFCFYRLIQEIFFDVDFWAENVTWWQKSTLKTLQQEVEAWIVSFMHD